MKRLRYGVAVWLAVAPLLAIAHEARTLPWVKLRAGPGQGFPLLARLASATRLTVGQCTRRATWCQVVAPGARHGWVYAPNIS